MSRNPALTIQEMSKTEKELSVVFLSTFFLKEYLSDVIKSKDDFPKHEPVFKLLLKQTKIAKLFSKKVDTTLRKAAELFEQIELEAKGTKPLRKFETKVRLDKDGDVVVNSLLFASALILEHRNLENRFLKLDYKLAEEIYSDFENSNIKVVTNSRAMCKKFIERLR